MHEGVTGIADWLWQNQDAYRTKCLEALSLFEGERLSGLNASAYLSSGVLNEPGEYDAYYWNVPRSLVNAVTAKVAGRQRPKPSLVCSDADWETKRRSKKLERFCEAQLHQRQGQFRNTWELTQRVFIDAAVFGCGLIKIFADLDSKRVSLERWFPWEMLVDPVESLHGEPLNFFTIHPYDADTLLEKFPGKEDAILNAVDDVDREFYAAGQRLAQSVKVYEAWRLPIGGKPGKHIICTKKGVLLVEDWTRDEPPFVFLRWSPELLGFGAKSLVDEAAPIAREVNHTLERMREAERLMSNATIIYEEGSLTNDEALNDNRIGVKVAYQKGFNPPNVVTPNAFSESTLNWLRMNYDKSFELTGVSQMSAASKKEPGVTAGVALRTIAAMETERFSVIYGAYEWMVAVDIPRHQLACTRELASEHKDFELKWPGSKFLSSIPWDQASLDEDMYVMLPYSVAGITHTPADNLQLGQDLYNSGLIGQESLLQIIQYKDTPSELARQNDQYSVIEKYIESWLDATPEAQEDGSFRYRAPIPFMNHPAALLQVARAYMVYELEGAPDWNLEFFLRFMQQCDEQIQKIAQQQAALAGAAKGAPAPPVGPLPGAPAPAPMVN
jgi:hypothetical protein